MEHIDTVVIGAGVAGLAIARALGADREVAVLERHPCSGHETSSRNSGVIHAGLYYPQHFLKTRLCIEGREQLYSYCRTHNIPHRRCGKLLIATTAAEVPALQQLQRQAEANGVSGLQWLDKTAVNEREPEIQAAAALYSPDSGIIDVPAYLQQLECDIRSNGSHVLHSQTVSAIARTAGGFVVTTNGTDSIHCQTLVNAAGLAAQEIAAPVTPAQHIPARHLAKGHYFAYRGTAPFRHLVYPLPERNATGLGIHATLNLQGNMRFGPDAGYVDTIDYGFAENRQAAFAAAIRRYYPALDESRLAADFTGIRPKIQAATDSVKDFRIDAASVHGVPGLVNLFGIESPGLTASLAIGEYVHQLLR